MGGLTPPVVMILLLGAGDFSIPLGPFISDSVILLLLFVALSFGLSEPLINFCRDKLTFLASWPLRLESPISEDKDRVICDLCLGVVPGEELSSVLDVDTCSSEVDTWGTWLLLARRKLPLLVLDTELELFSASSRAWRSLQWQCKFYVMIDWLSNFCDWTLNYEVTFWFRW